MVKRFETEKGENAKPVLKIQSLLSNERKVINLSSKRTRVNKSRGATYPAVRAEVVPLLGHGRKSDLRHGKMTRHALIVEREEYLRKTGKLMPLGFFRHNLETCVHHGGRCDGIYVSGICPYRKYCVPICTH